MEEVYEELETLQKGTEPHLINTCLERLRQKGFNLLELHAKLSPEALLVFYRLRDQLNLSRDVLEHLIWRTHEVHVVRANNPVSMEQLEAIHHHACVENYIGSQATLVALINCGRLNDQQLHWLAQNAQKVKEVQKQINLRRL